MEAVSQKWLEEAVTPIEYVQKGAKTSFEDVRSHRHVVKGHAPVPVAPGRAFVPRRTRLGQQDFDDFGYTQGCRGCEYLQTGIGQRQNHSDQCQDRIEEELTMSDQGRARLHKSKDRIDHGAAKSREDTLNEQKTENEQCMGNAASAEKGQTVFYGVENEQRVDVDAGGRGPEEFDISGSLVKEPEEDIELASRGIVPSEKRLRTPERTPARRRRHPTTDRNSPRKRLIVDDENMTDLEDGQIVDMQFEDGSGGGGASASGAG